ncbi:MAG: hypothetical protein K2W82_17230 [Candidatus Obscuribacterales bacterium]|nr:hypothetical protein [Candidatus Obscuribacterales bacterium]
MEINDSNIVRNDGVICLMTYDEAARYCQEHGGLMPSTRMFASFMNPQNILEVDHVDKVLQGQVPEGYYKVDSQDENGVVDSFYYNNAGGRALSGDLAVNSFWTSSIVLGKPDFAHVFYGPLGGGGGAAHEHARTYKHAVILVAK